MDVVVAMHAKLFFECNVIIMKIHHASQSGSHWLSSFAHGFHLLKKRGELPIKLSVRKREKESD